MATNFKQHGEVLHYKVLTTDNIKSGDVVSVGEVVGIAITDGKPNELLAVGVIGVYSVPKTAALAITQGAKVYYNKTTKYATVTATDTFIGYAWSAAIGSDATVDVKLKDVFA